jgi:hypothetical protein
MGQLFKKLAKISIFESVPAGTIYIHYLFFIEQNNQLNSVKD